MSLPQEILEYEPQIGLVLGSGLGFFADERLERAGSVRYESIPGFPVSTVEGHAGQFVYGTLEGYRVLCMQGRFHFYEGYPMRELTLPVRLMAQAGVKHLFLTNAAGGINPEYRPGDFMLLSDHINFLGTNPLIGPVAPGETRFPDMSEVYDASLRKRIKRWAESHSIPLHEGVYLATTGPSYETPAEIRFFHGIGADAVGMSTVPEAIVARQQGMRVIGISCITNAAAGLSETPLSHEEVGDTANRVKSTFADLLSASIQLISSE
ncbi:purine-nucleoside phosphorylase [Coraliomargarita parva]|uniref:purine-nucleoside phosphorylase n=1 Tax=Coraliomargarita parva TaxID=3014050 RepID=UPI0022B49C28|nr:purine-nucleoside phosphorylase [Coraliomargarita parva]